MTWKNSQPIFRSHPIRLHWMGWETDTLRLQANGWDLSASEDMEYRKMAIAFRHKQGPLKGITDFVDWDYFQNVDSHWAPVYPELSCRMANDIRIQHSTMDHDFNNFRAIDARPMMEVSTGSFDDLVHFRSIEEPSNEIFLKNASMQEIMEMALQKQEPRQEQIRKQMIHQQEVEIMNNSKLKANLRLVA